MVSLSHALAFAAASLVIIVIPGPSVLFVIGRALAYGRRTALASVAGNAAGALVLAAAVALGLGTVVARSALIFSIVKLAGAGYLVYLGIRALLRGREHFLPGAGEDARTGRRAGFDGFLVGVANPKTAIFFAAVLPQFAEPSRGHLSVQFLLLGLIFVSIALVCDSAWGVVAGAARAWFGRSPRRLRAIGGAGGLAMIGLGIGVAVTGRRD